MNVALFVYTFLVSSVHSDTCYVCKSPDHHVIFRADLTDYDSFYKSNTLQDSDFGNYWGCDADGTSIAPCVYMYFPTTSFTDTAYFGTYWGDFFTIGYTDISVYIMWKWQGLQDGSTAVLEANIYTKTNIKSTMTYHKPIVWYIANMPSTTGFGQEYALDYFFYGNSTAAYNYINKYARFGIEFKAYGAASNSGTIAIIQNITVFGKPITSDPTTDPTGYPTAKPTKQTYNPTTDPSEQTIDPTVGPSNNPSVQPTQVPSDDPTTSPSNDPSVSPSGDPTTSPSDNPSISPSYNPSALPSDNPSVSPSGNPTISPSDDPSASPSDNPTKSPTPRTRMPTTLPSYNPTAVTVSPSDYPTTSPSTKRPTAVTLKSSTTMITLTSNNGGISDNGTGSKTGLDTIPSLVWFILVVILTVLLCIIFCLWFIKKRLRKRKEVNTIKDEMSNLNTDIPYVQLTDNTHDTKL